MKFAVRSALVVAAFVLAACGGASDPAQDIVSTAPAGTFNGQSWTMSKATVQSDGTTLTVHLFSDSSVADCALDEGSSTAGYLLFTMPAKTGERPLQLSLSDFSDPTTRR